MNTKKAYRPDYQLPEMIESVMVNGRTLRSGMEVSVHRAPARRGGRYRFDFARRDHRSGLLTLEVYGPLRTRSIPHYRTIVADDIRTVHIKTGEG